MNENEFKFSRTWSLVEHFKHRLQPAQWTATRRPKQSNRRKAQRNKEKLLILVLQDVLNRKYGFNLEKHFWWKSSKTNIQEGHLESINTVKFQVQRGEQKHGSIQWESKFLLISKIFTSTRRQCYMENHELIIDLLKVKEMTGNSKFWEEAWNWAFEELKSEPKYSFTNSTNT